MDRLYINIGNTHLYVSKLMNGKLLVSLDEYDDEYKISSTGLLFSIEDTDYKLSKVLQMYIDGKSFDEIAEESKKDCTNTPQDIIDMFEKECKRIEKAKLQKYKNEHVDYQGFQN